MAAWPINPFRAKASDSCQHPAEIVQQVKNTILRSQLLRRRSTCILLGHKKVAVPKGKGMNGQTLEP